MSEESDLVTLDRRRVARGAVLIIIAVLLAGLGRVLAQGGQHAYDPDAVAPTSGYQLTIGTVYQLSTTGGVGQLQRKGLLQSGTDPQCFYASIPEPSKGKGMVFGTGHPVTIVSTKDDGRDLHVFATFRIDATGRFQISCTDITQVFVDDADGTGFGFSSLLVLLSVLVGVLGVIALIGGLSGYGTDPGNRLT